MEKHVIMVSTKPNRVLLWKYPKNGIDNGSSAYLDKELWVVDNLNYFIRYFTNNTIRIVYKNSEQCLQK